TQEGVNQNEADNDDSEDDEDSEDNEEKNSEYENDGKFEDFPESFRDDLEELQDDHPSWKFEAKKVNVDFDDALEAECEGSRSLVNPSEPKSWRSDSDKRYDGYWYKANKKTVAHFLDARNFLNEKDIYQFMDQSYDSETQNTETIGDIIDGSFMDDNEPGGGYETFESCIQDAGAEAGVNPNVLAAMIIMEQGWDGSSLCTGKKKGYKGYYNFFNIGAWTTDSMSSVERGLWYAKGEGEGNTSYQRPWDSPYKAIVGGAEFYNENYISDNQNTYYTKKFNVMNGADSIGSHEYMTNVSGALDEGRLVRKAYEDQDDLPVTFQIPVYDDMPDKKCQLPD
ncbi:MAG: glucosaminidase domain-containing protein, partial [Firmicutes bacterium]|nr:glucosaminidase domain-containing protein [Bacillota bacterium]